MDLPICNRGTGFVVPDIYKPLMMCNANRSSSKVKQELVGCPGQEVRIMAGQPTPPGHVPSPEIAGLIKGL